MDIEHLQLFSRGSARALLERSGLRRRRACSASRNRYPLHYWLKLAPCPARAKRALVAGARRGPLRSLSLSLPVGNLAVTGFRRALSGAALVEAHDGAAVGARLAADQADSRAAAARRPSRRR